MEPEPTQSAGLVSGTHLPVADDGPPPLVPRQIFMWLFEAPKGLVVGLGALISCLNLWLDAAIHSDISTGILYIIPSLILGLRLRYPTMLAISIAFALFREQFGSHPWQEDWLARMFYGLLSFVGASLFSGEMARNRRNFLRHSRALAEEVARREEAENQLKTLIESSPAAIVTLDAAGRVLLANHAADDLFRLPSGSLLGQDLGVYLPTMGDVAQNSGSDLPYRTATNCRGRRSNGESFLACVWFATYSTGEGRRLAAIITDSSEDLRDWQETSLQSLLRSTRVLVGSVSHEIRNICAAIAMVHANLGRLSGVAGTEDYAALGTLAQGLARLATVELHPTGEPELEIVSLAHLLEEFRIVVAPAVEAAEVHLEIRCEDRLPPVCGDRHGLLQVLMNLFRNSVRALENCAVRRIEVDARLDAEVVLVRVSDSGPGVSSPERLFQPFQQGADAVGLGLFVSRAIVRAGEGELYYEPSASGCTMCLKLKVSAPADGPFEALQTERQL